MLKNTENIADFPKIVPIFPLSEVILLPKGQIKLNIFENRYVNMTEDCLASDRILGMIQPIKENQLYEVGCIGKIIHFIEVEQNKFFIELKGICRYKLINHSITKRKYRKAEVNYSDFNNDLSAKKARINKKEFLEPMKKYFDFQKIQTDWSIINKAPIELLVNSLAQSCPFSTIEKQALLEAEDTNSRANLMISLFEIGAAGPVRRIN
mgnify:FL=1